MTILASLLLVLVGLALLVFGGIGMLFALGGEPPDAGALGFTVGCLVLGLVLCALGLKRLLGRG